MRWDDDPDPDAYSDPAADTPERSEYSEDALVPLGPWTPRWGYSQPREGTTQTVLTKVAITAEK